MRNCAIKIMQTEMVDKIDIDEVTTDLRHQTGLAFSRKANM